MDGVIILQLRYTKDLFLNRSYEGITHEDLWIYIYEVRQYIDYSLKAVRFSNGNFKAIDPLSKLSGSCYNALIDSTFVVNAR